MSPVRIFVEGIADKRFLSELIADCCTPDALPHFDFQNLKGKDNLLARAHWESQASFFREITGEGGTNLVIIDTDDSHAGRMDELRKFQEATGVQFVPFLLPDHSRPGELEDLLFDAVPDENKKILACFDGMVTCLRGAPQPFEVPNVKEKKVFVYLDILLPEAEIKREQTKPDKRAFRDAPHWDLSAEGVQKLRAFLTRHLLRVAEGDQ